MCQKTLLASVAAPFPHENQKGSLTYTGIIGSTLTAVFDLNVNFCCAKSCYSFLDLSSNFQICEVFCNTAFKEGGNGMVNPRNEET